MSRRTTLLVLALAAIPRLLIFPFAENVAGDAVVRSWLAHGWLEHPHLIGSSLQGCVQYGPLHVILVALVEWLTGSEHLAGRLLSLIVGTLSAWPLFALARRVFADRAAWWSVLVFSLWPLHIQASTTAASESLSGLFVLMAVAAVARAFDTGEREVLFAGGLSLTVAAAVRYDVWLWVPLLAGLVWWRTRSFGRAFVFGAIAASFPIAWLLGHLVDAGELLFPIRVIDDYHRAWFRSESAIWGASAYRLIVLGFWPLTAAATFTPIVTIIGAVALVKTRSSSARWLMLVVAIPAVLLSLRGAVLESFVPLSRFTMKELSLFVVFVGAGLAALESRSSWAAWACGPLLLLWLPLVEVAARTPWRWSYSFRAVSALSLNGEDLRVVAKELRSRASPSDLVAVDVDPRGFDDIQLAFESGLPFRQVARRRAPSFEAFAKHETRWLVLFDGGVMTASFEGVAWREVARSGPVTLLERAP